MRQNWYQTAAGDHENNLLSNYPIYHIPEPFRGYHVIYEQSGIGLIINEPLNNKDLAVAIISASIPEFTDNQRLFSLCFAREISYNFWDKNKYKWKQLLTYLIALRTKGWLIQPTSPYSMKRCQGTSISCPITSRIEMNLPFYLPSNPLGLAMDCHKYLQDLYYLLEVPIEHQESSHFTDLVNYEKQNFEESLHLQLKATSVPKIINK